MANVLPFDDKGLEAEYLVEGLPGVGLVVESDPQFPDPAAARVVIRKRLEGITGIEAETSKLVEQAEDIMETKEDLAKRMQEGQEDSTTVTPRGMYN